MTSAQKRKVRKTRIMAVIYLLAAIGAFTVASNVYHAGRSAVNHAKAWTNSLEFKTPVLVQSTDD